MTSKKKVAFGSSSVRTAPITRTHEDLFPGPAHYTNTDKKPKQQDVQLSSTFASLTDRLHSPPPIVKVTHFQSFHKLLYHQTVFILDSSFVVSHDFLAILFKIIKFEKGLLSVGISRENP